MKKLFTYAILIIIVLGGFYWYTQSGVVLEEAAPMVPDEEITKEPIMLVEEQKKIDDMVAKANDPAMTSAEKMAMEKESTMMMNPTPIVTKVMPPKTSTEMSKSGIGRQGSFTTIDLVHKASGLTLIYPITTNGPVLRLQDFSVTRGPDLYVYLSKNSNITSSSQLGDYVSIGKLKSSKGDQNYPLPNNHAEYKSVVIWCKAFGVLFSSATLDP
jgi:hypothetical protein